MKLWFLFALLSAALCAVLGIDYGTEFTKSSLLAPNAPFEIVLTADSKRKDASGLVFKSSSDDTERVYGSSGVALSSRFPSGAAYYLKPLLGQVTDSAEVEEHRAYHPGLKFGTNARGGIDVTIGKDSFPVEELVAMGFQNAKQRAESLLKSKAGSSVVKDVALSVPGHYSMQQRKALEDSVGLAGLDLIALVNDGVAVAVNYASTRRFDESKQYFVVYDMGAESTTSTLFSIQDVNSTQLVVEGFGFNPKLGGQAVTALVRNMLLERFAKKHKSSKALAENPRVLNRLWREAERVKSILSANSEVTVHVESLVGDEDLDTKITRNELEKAAHPLVRAVKEPLLDSLNTFDGEKIPLEDVTSIVLAGGGTRMPFVQAQIRDVAGDLISKNVNADESVVMGTTLRGVGLSGIFKSKAINITDKSISDYSVSINGGELQTIFPRGSPLSSSSLLNFSPDSDEADVALLENGKHILTWKIPYCEQAIDILKEDETRRCVDEPVVEAKFALSNSGIVRLADVAARCMGELRQNASDTEGAVPVRKMSRFLSAKTSHTGVTPLSTANKQQLLYHMKSLDKADSERQEREILHNELEALLYRVREIAPADKTVHALLKWLEESKVTTTELRAKLREARDLFKAYSQTNTNVAGSSGASDDHGDAHDEIRDDANDEIPENVGDEIPEDADDVTTLVDEASKKNTHSKSSAPTQSDKHKIVDDSQRDSYTFLLRLFDVVGLEPGDLKDSNWLRDTIAKANRQQLMEIREVAAVSQALGGYKEQFLELLDKALEALPHDEL